jgi:DNA-binding XRE family transcriptional regulator
MKQRSFNNLRKHRKRHALSTNDLAALVGHRKGTSVSAIERGERLPSLRAALGFEAVFGVAARDLFPGFYEVVQDEAMRRAGVMHEKLEGRRDPRSKAKRELIEEMPSRPGASDIEL